LRATLSFQEELSAFHPGSFDVVDDAVVGLSSLNRHLIVPAGPAVPNL
jgi:hypothetical protein